ncbi:CLPTM1 domain-containing protein [Histoplasma capsulatum]|uniref:CLPTM1 domain-containing protein n=1 Tax=Ajellomyces capsulatus TaxID=5037 RepID=A0A8A1MEW6_AJECA|nr:CLPTM1 domain protein [Histoplasma mississippiense (nom. inval.)]EDN08640.1 CLPTM1 domain protein [Histoplasma mississippiense (nom. inval.)]QSS63223.1 CLPTM1 domain-containing protein [Histoplasma capsulatum]
MSGRRQQQEEQGLGSFIRTALQGLAFFVASQFLFSQILGTSKSGQNSGNVGSVSGGNAAIPAFTDRPDIRSIPNATIVPYKVAPIWPMNSSVDISIYVSPSTSIQSLDTLPEDAKVLEEKNFTIGDWDDTREIVTSFKVPKEVQQNGTLWAHFYMSLSGHPLNPNDKGYSSANAVYFCRLLNHYLPKKKVKKLKNLLSADEAEDDEVLPQGIQIGSFYHPNFTLSVIPDTGIVTLPSMAPAARQYLQLETTGARDATGQNGWYYPILFVNTFWQLKSHMIELNSTVETLPLHITLKNLQNWKFTLLANIDESTKQNQRQAASGGPFPAGGDGSEFETFKEILLDTNSYLLATTFFVSILHMIFEGLAFKNDISHWRQKKDSVGTSLRTILANVFMQTVIFLYLLDNSEGTSWMILGGQAFGIVLEAWKITKTVDIRLRRPRPGSAFSFLPYVVVFEDKHKLSETEQKTKEYDEIAFRYLYILAVPLLAAYAVYSLMYEDHKSWYSFVIETLVGSVYAYGFLMMVPSLYINYRLKSVAHMPGKALTYKFLNTFIDDLFAFTIKMPTLHRIATLRDDVIFFIWLYQSYKYKVDYTRVNEFGQGGEAEENEETKPEEQPKSLKDSEPVTASEPETSTLGTKTTTESVRKRK